MARYQQHILFWLAFLFFKVYLNITSSVTDFELIPEVSGSIIYQYLTLQFTWLVVQVPFVYTMLYILNQFLSGRIARLTLIMVVVGLFIVGSMAMSFVNHYFILPYIIHYVENEFSVFSIGSLVYHSFSLGSIVGLAATFKLIRWQARSRVREINLQNEKTSAELKYLKGQVNPHFLFNTLNNIYGLARKKSDATAESILKLSKLMRFMLFDASQQRIKVSDELRLIEDYISLERLRYSERVNIAFIHSLDNPNEEVAPLLLIHFVENAFKHGVSESQAESFVNIDIQLKEHVLKATIRNSIPDGASEVSGEKIGMDNIKRQLELLYPQFTLDVLKSPEAFQITLTLPL